MRTLVLLCRLSALKLQIPAPAATLLLPLVLLAANASAATFQNAGPTLNGDDNHSSSVSPFPAIAVSSITDPPGQCVWITTGIDNFIAKNPTDGTGPSKEGWKYKWAGVAQEAKVEAGINILDYFPYVVTRPSVTDAAGNVYAASPSGEYGGCVINLSYTPTAANGAPVLSNLHWIQALNGTLYGNPTGGGSAILDTPFDGGGAAFVSQSDKTIFYDTFGAAGTYDTNKAFFEDRPLVPELNGAAEYENNPIASVQFQVILVSDNPTTDAKGVVQHDLTLYGGEWWGFTYSAVDVPEPAACCLLAFGACRLVLRRRPASPA